MQAIVRLALVTLLISLPASAYAQLCREAITPAGDTLARKFAPILEFGPGERYFPTIPFFPAFDQLSGSAGLNDSARVADKGSRRRISWDKLDAAYASTLQATGVKLVPRLSAVFYRVRCLDEKENRRVIGFLRNDPQAWGRMGLEELYAQGLAHAQFRVAEYYLYYVADTGLEGHPYDIERVFVFLPREVELEEAWLRGGKDGRKRLQQASATNKLVDRLRIVVGTGHSPTTPNNILVVTGPQAEKLTLPGILVELGGHSSAPDLNYDSRLNRGYDVNWNLTASLWGTRDVQAVSGLAFLGSYEDWMTLPRQIETSVTLQPLITEEYEAGARVAAAGRADTIEARQTGRVPESAEEIQQEVRKTKQHRTETYVLLPVTPFKKLYEELAIFAEADHKSDTAGMTESIAAIKTIVADSIQPLLEQPWGFTGFDEVPEDAVTQVVRQMVHWTLATESAKKASLPTQRSIIWEHPEFDGSAVWTLKRRLYRPSMHGIRNAGDVFGLLTMGVNASLGRGGQEFQIGFVVPGRRFIFPIPGVFEPRFGFYRRRLIGGPEFGPTHYSFSITYERHYKALFSWYAKPINYVSRRSFLEGDPEASSFGFGFGASVMPLFPFPQVLKGVGQFLRFRLGFRIDAPGWEPRIHRFEFQGVVYFR